MPVTMPVPSTLATAALEVTQVPPAEASVKLTDDPVQTEDGPLIVPADGEAPTVTTVVIKALEQAVVTV